MTLLGPSSPNNKERSSICTRCFHWVGYVAQRETATCSGSHSTPPRLSPKQPLSHLETWPLGGAMCCSYLPSAALQVLISRPPIRCPALAATVDFPQTGILTWPVCSCPELQGLTDTWDHTGGVKEATRSLGCHGLGARGWKRADTWENVASHRTVSIGGRGVHQVMKDSW